MCSTPGTLLVHTGDFRLGFTRPSMALAHSGSASSSSSWRCKLKLPLVVLGTFSSTVGITRPQLAPSRCQLPRQSSPPSATRVPSPTASPLIIRIGACRRMPKPAGHGTTPLLQSTIPCPATLARPAGAPLPRLRHRPRRGDVRAPAAPGIAVPTHLATRTHAPKRRPPRPPHPGPLPTTLIAGPLPRPLLSRLTRCAPPRPHKRQLMLSLIGLGQPLPPLLLTGRRPPLRPPPPQKTWQPRSRPSLARAHATRRWRGR